MIIAAVLIFSVIIFPIFLNINVIYNYEHKKAYYLLQLFGFVKLVCGYIQILDNMVVIHVTDTKAIIFKYLDFKGVKKNFKPIMDYHFINFESKTEIGLKNNTLFPLTAVFIVNYVESIIKWILYNNKPYLNLDNKFSVYEGENKLNHYGKLLITLNLLMIIISFIKIIMEKIIYEFRKVKQQN